jgi:hypothetical protein
LSNISVHETVTKLNRARRVASGVQTVLKFDPPNPAQIAEGVRALLESGEITHRAARIVLPQLLEELRRAFELSADALRPIDALIGELNDAPRRWPGRPGGIPSII